MDESGSDSLADNVALLEAWHLDGCLHALAICEALSSVTTLGTSTVSWDQAARAVIDEICHRRSALTEHSIRFWITRLCEPALCERGDAHLQRRLCASLLRLEAEEAAMGAAAVAALRDMSFLLE